jgi:uracil-DNA glycosylase
MAQLSLEDDGTAGSAEDLIPQRPSLKSLREAAAGCKACPLWQTGTQTVFGEGPKRARVIMVGEQPGDREDLAGKPFVGPAGKLLDRALADAEIERRDVYITNAVKHFKWSETRGKRRIHQTPSAKEVAACRPWLESEIAVIEPEVLVALGATAAKAVIGPDFRVTKDRGSFVESRFFAPIATGTVHPSAILRIDEDDERRIAIDELVDDLVAVRTKLDS